MLPKGAPTAREGLGHTLAVPPSPEPGSCSLRVPAGCLGRCQPHRDGAEGGRGFPAHGMHGRAGGIAGTGAAAAVPRWEQGPYSALPRPGRPGQCPWHCPSPSRPGTRWPAGPGLGGTDRAHLSLGPRRGLLSGSSWNLGGFSSSLAGVGAVRRRRRRMITQPRGADAGTEV